MADDITISSYFKQGPQATGKDVSNEGLRMAQGQIEKIYFVDDAANVSKTFVEYDVSVRDSHGGQSTFRNIRSAYSFFGLNDFDETVLEANEIALNGKLDPSNFFKNKNGTVVILAFLDGLKDKPVIVGALQHPRKVGAKRSEGIRKKGEFRGFGWEINKDGEFTLTFNGPRSPDGKLKGSNGPTQIKIDKTGALSITDKANQTIKIDRAAKTIVLQNGTKIAMDNGADSVTITTSAGGTVKIVAGKIAIGASGTELLQQIVDILDKIITLSSTESSHMHLGNLGFPTGPTTAAGAWSSLASDLGTIKGKINGIKGSL